MIIERATTKDYQDLKDLWKIVFDEDPVFLDHFFSKRIYFEHIFIARSEQRIVSALHALPLSYQKGGSVYPVSYIVGAATYKEYRKRGIMSKLLASVAAAYDHPVTLFPAVRAFYEANGYFTTSFVASYQLEATEQRSGVMQLPLDLDHLDFIYNEATQKQGSLIRDREAWTFLTDGYETLLIDGAYALLSEGKAVEVMAVSKASASSMVELLRSHSILEIQVLEDSPFPHLLDQNKMVLTPMGMSTERTMQGVYIAEQY